MSKEVASLILKYFKESLRPFSANDIVEKFGKEHGKPTILKSIDNLVSKELITEKTFGKQKIYFFKDNNYNNENAVSVSALEDKLQKLNSDLKLKQEEIQHYGNQLTKIKNLPSIQELEAEREKIKYKIETNIEKLNRINYLQSSQKTGLKLEQIIKIDLCHEKISTIYRQRKRLCTEMLDSIMDAYPKTKKHLIEEIGIETDESVGFKINQ